MAPTCNESMYVSEEEFFERFARDCFDECGVIDEGTWKSVSLTNHQNVVKTTS